MIKLMHQQDPRCIEMIYDEYADALYGLAMRIVKDENLASDTLQDAMVKVWKNCASYAPKKSKVFTWLFNIVRNCAIDQLRKNAKHRDREIRSGVENVQSKSEPSYGESVDLADHLVKLEEKYRIVIELMFYRGYTQQEASDKLAIPLGTVKTRLRIGLREMRKIYSEV